MIALLLPACQPLDSGRSGKDDTGSVNSRGDTSPEETDAPIDCEDGHDTDIACARAEPCDPTLPWVDVSAGGTQTCGVQSDECGNVGDTAPEIPSSRFPTSRSGAFD